MSFFDFSEDVERAQEEAADLASRLSARTIVHRSSLPAAARKAGFGYQSAGGYFAPGKRDLVVGVVPWSDPGTPYSGCASYKRKRLM